MPLVTLDKYQGSSMDSNNEIKKIMLECKNKGINSREVLQLMEVPYEWTGDSYLFNFDSMPIEELSDYINYIFRKRWYILEKGTPVDGFYSKSKMVSDLNPNEYATLYCRYKVEIYSRGGKTYLEIIMPYHGHSQIEEKLIGDKYLEKCLNLKLNELDQIIDHIKFLKPLINGYLVCNKCGAYYEVHKEESPDLFDKNCECSGTFKYIMGPTQPDEKLVGMKKTAGPAKYLRAPAALILVSLSCFAGAILYQTVIINVLIGLFGLTCGMCFMLMRYRSHELVLEIIYRRLIYLLAAVLFFVGSWGLINVIIQIDNYNITMLEFSLFAVLSVIYGLGMIFKMISPDNPRNFLDPPL